MATEVRIAEINGKHQHQPNQDGLPTIGKCIHLVHSSLNSVAAMYINISRTHGACIPKQGHREHHYRRCFIPHIQHYQNALWKRNLAEPRPYFLHTTGHRMQSMYDTCRFIQDRIFLPLYSPFRISHRRAYAL